MNVKSIFTMMLFGAMCMGFVSCEKEEKIVLPSKNEDNTDDLNNAILERLYNGHEAVDLGLPSGLLWATCNVGAENPEDYGDYFAWGEVSEKNNYTWETYKYGIYNDNDTYDYGMIKYNKSDKRNILNLSDDAARVNWGGIWRMPTNSEQNELISECTWTWTSKNGKNGYEIKGKNGNSIFLPAAGNCEGNSINNIGTYGFFWSSSNWEEVPNGAYLLAFHVDKIDWSYHNRSYGLSIRPVCSPK